MGIITEEPAKYRCALVFWNLFFANVVIFLAAGQNNWIIVIPERNSIRSVEKFPLREDSTRGGVCVLGKVAEVWFFFLNWMMF
ncbi:hypothetical protein HNY73_011134 [Argiope bruennichi]|uniref:Uncharacterized protein n=1 Tax=Argiope bruennichi TaxID=94029 RepID=A0A8T0F376_ARGBR|nr:hypothetical protein HNY73_011134 [Argiope bruennichi]